MSSKPQSDVCYLSQGWRRLVNAYEQKEGMV